MSYPGGKNGAGVYQRLINQIPPHDVYIEPFLGAGAIMLAKRLAGLSIGIDVDPFVIKGWRGWVNLWSQPTKELFEMDAVECIKARTTINTRNTFIYCDPPYLMETRKSGPIYKYEYTEAQHIKLLKLLLSLEAMVMISGYRHKIYDDAMGGWRRMDYMANTRQGMVPESAWMNYPQPTELHDYRYLGDDFRERERIARKIKRWTKRLEKMPVLERQAILSVLTTDNPNIPAI